MLASRHPCLRLRPPGRRGDVDALLHCGVALLAAVGQPQRHFVVAAPPTAQLEAPAMGRGSCAEAGSTQSAAAVHDHPLRPRRRPAVPPQPVDLLRSAGQGCAAVLSPPRGSGKPWGAAKGPAATCRPASRPRSARPAARPSPPDGLPSAQQLHRDGGGGRAARLHRGHQLPTPHTLPQPLASRRLPCTVSKLGGRGRWPVESPATCLQTFDISLRAGLAAALPGPTGGAHLPSIQVLGPSIHRP